MNITEQMPEISFLINMNGLEWALEKDSAPFPFGIEVHCVSGAEFLHESRNTVFLLLPQEEMKVIRHETKAKYVRDDVSLSLSNVYRGEASIVELGVEERSSVIARK